MSAYIDFLSQLGLNFKLSWCELPQMFARLQIDLVVSGEVFIMNMLGPRAVNNLVVHGSRIVGKLPSNNYAVEKNSLSEIVSDIGHHTGGRWPYKLGDAHI